jgi:hypothetical protein
MNALSNLWQRLTSIHRPRMSKTDPFAHGQIATGQLLAIGTLKGLWTLEHFDHPPRVPNDVRPVNVRNPAPYRNLAREWIAANPQQWDALLKQHLNAEP